LIDAVMQGRPRRWRARPLPRFFSGGIEILQIESGVFAQSEYGAPESAINSRYDSSGRRALRTSAANSPFVGNIDGADLSKVAKNDSVPELPRRAEVTHGRSRVNHRRWRSSVSVSCVRWPGSSARPPPLARSSLSLASTVITPAGLDRHHSDSPHASGTASKLLSAIPPTPRAD